MLGRLHRQQESRDAIEWRSRARSLAETQPLDDHQAVSVTACTVSAGGQEQSLTPGNSVFEIQYALESRVAGRCHLTILG